MKKSNRIVLSVRLLFSVNSNGDVKNNAKKCKNMVDNLEKYMLL